MQDKTAVMYVHCDTILIINPLVRLRLTKINN